MSERLLQELGLSLKEREDIGKTVGKIKSISEFLSDFVDAVKKSNYPEAIATAAPWAGIIGESLAEAVPPVKFAVKLFEKLTKEYDPEVLGLLACTLAYERAAQKAFEEIGVPESPKKVSREIKSKILEAESSEAPAFKGFSFNTALNHQFVAAADDILLESAASLGYTDVQRRKLEDAVHRRFVPLLKAILSNGKLKEKFAPFTLLMDLGTEEQQAYDALLEHAEYQRWLYEEAPVFEKEPFALMHVYVDTDCGRLRWRDIASGAWVTDERGERKKVSVDPFSEKWGGRGPLTEAVLALIGDKDFGDAIVIQGVAGAGKSSFTLKLCSELAREGLHPIRVRLKDLQLDRHVSEALPRALFPPDKAPQASGRALTGREDHFLGGRIFNEKTTFRGATICPYVLVLDGWDEISVSATEGFKIRLAKMLDEIRNEYLRNRPVPVRLVLTGRPSEAVSDSRFLRDETEVLTIRPLRPDQLRVFVTSLLKSVSERPVAVPQTDESWHVTDIRHFGSIFSRYSKDFEASVGRSQREEQMLEPPSRRNAGSNGSVAVLGLPLLAHLAVRLISRRSDDPIDLVENSTTLYRSLVDLTCERGGKQSGDPAEIGGQLRITGNELRDLLCRTAEAMTVYGKESIPFMELALRLNLDDETLNNIATQATEDHVLTSLVISFFFKGGHSHLGCEFLHKSFREYLFAERIVEILKAYGRDQSESLTVNLPERTPYWKDFDGDSSIDLRFNFSRELSQALAPQWLSPEVCYHVGELIKWEVSRCYEISSGSPTGTPTARLPIDGWNRVRDGLADIWDWWAEGVHLRPQLNMDRKTRNVGFEATYVQELAELSAPHDPSERGKRLEPVRVTAMDAHLGDGLFRLCSTLHFELAKASGWLEVPGPEGRFPLATRIWVGASRPGSGPRRCQTTVQGKWVLFAPSGGDPGYFVNYLCRIGSGGWRPLGPFPLNADLSGIDLRGATIVIPIPRSEPSGFAVWRFANLSGCTASGSCFYNHEMSNVLAEKANFWFAMFDLADLADSVLCGSDLRGATLQSANLEHADLRQAVLNRSDLQGVVLRFANLESARLERANLEEANLEEANLEEANLAGADLARAYLEGARMEGALHVGEPIGQVRSPTPDLHAGNLEGEESPNG